MSRLRALVFVGAALVGLGVVVTRSWPGRESHLRCSPEQLGTVEHNGMELVACVGDKAAPVVPMRASIALTLGRKVDLNAMKLEDFLAVQGLSKKVAMRLVERRRSLGRFRAWEEVDAVEGMGPGKLTALQALAEIRE